MEKDEFLTNILHFRFDPASIPSEWMSEAWESAGVRENLTYDIKRIISKTGKIDYDEGFQNLLGRSLTCDQVVGLYVFIRDNAYRSEEEWRPQFTQIFARCAGSLPAPLIDPYNDWYLNGRDYPREWMESAWADDRIREGVVEGMARDLDRGDESWCGADWIDLLDRSLTREQIVRLFTDLRSRAERPESEWRWVFEKAFSDCADHFPPRAT